MLKVFSKQYLSWKQLYALIVDDGRLMALQRLYKIYN